MAEIDEAAATRLAEFWSAEVAALKDAAREYEHYVMTGRDEQHERLVAELSAGALREIADLIDTHGLELAS